MISFENKILRLSWIAHFAVRSWHVFQDEQAGRSLIDHKMDFGKETKGNPNKQTKHVKSLLLVRELC